MASSYAVVAGTRNSKQHGAVCKSKGDEEIVLVGSLSSYAKHLEFLLDEKLLKYHFFWLRDHCKCEECYNAKTFQIASDINAISLDIKPKRCERTAEELIIQWQDDHLTTYSLTWLQGIDFENSNEKKEKVFWNNQVAQSLRDTSVTVGELENDDGVKSLLNSVLKYGFGVVTNVEPTMEATENVVKKVAFIQRTIFGDMWEVTNDYRYKDTAYSDSSIGVHTDNTYFSNPAGIQVFHMLSHQGTGGETTLVDGFNAATNLRLNNEWAFKVLTSTPLQAHYIDQGVHYSHTSSPITLDSSSGDMQQVRYNIYDRAALTHVPFEKILGFYESYKLFGAELNKPTNQMIIKLLPGTVLLIDNWRVLHGRASYTGYRRLAGCYIERSAWLSKAKALGL